ncbi:MAG: hypothetical protein ABH871_06810 [Pseudomonadota bacterium]
MKDTSACVHKKMISLMSKRSGEERLKMGASMFDTAKELIGPSSRAKVFLRLYGSNFSPKERQKILNHLRCAKNSKWQQAEEYGIDMSILDANLRKTPTGRLLTHQAALQTFLAFRDAGKRLKRAKCRISKSS